MDGVELNIDPGAKLAVSVMTWPKAHALIELRHRGSRIRNKMDKRRMMRRLRNRQPRFDNRTRPESWLAPSLVTRLANTETWVRRLAALYPISLVRVETARFDTQIMQDAEVSGREYQQGDLAGWQLRSYIFHRDGRKCAYCGNRRPSVTSWICEPSKQPCGELPRVQRRKGQPSEFLRHLPSGA